MQSYLSFHLVGTATDRSEVVSADQSKNSNHNSKVLAAVKELLAMIGPKWAAASCL